MRAVLQSAFTVTTGLGNLLVVLVEATLNKYLVRVSTCSTHYPIKNSNFTIFPVAIGLFVCWIDVCGHVAFGLDGIKIHIRGLHQERKEIGIHSVHVNHKVLILNLLSQKIYKIQIFQVYFGARIFDIENWNRVFFALEK